MQRVKNLILFFVMILFIAATVLFTHLPVHAKSQTTCPVLSGNIDKNVYVDYQGKRIYFCCPGCDVEFKKDPEKYLKKLQDEGVTPETAPQGKAGK